MKILKGYLKKDLIGGSSSIGLVLLLIAPIALGVEVVNEMTTRLFDNEQAALSEAEALSQEILSGKNKLANIEGALDCAGKNQPNFNITSIQPRIHYVPSKEGLVEKHQAHIFYVSLCGEHHKAKKTKLFEIEAGAQVTKGDALSEAKKVAVQVDAGGNPQALAEGFLECPEINNPGFKTHGIKVISYYPSDMQYSEKFVGVVSFNLDCTESK